MNKDPSHSRKHLMRIFGNIIDIIKLKESIDVLLFYQEEGQEVKLTSGSKWKMAGICPFHEDQQAGSFYIHCESGAFKCFACDSKGGDVITFTQKKYDLTFLNAIEKLARKWRAS